MSVHIHAQALEHNEIASVQVTAAPVGDGIAESLSDSPPRLIGGQFHALGLNGKVFSPVFFAQALAPFGEFRADAAPVRDIVKNL